MEDSVVSLHRGRWGNPVIRRPNDEVSMEFITDLANITSP